MYPAGDGPNIKNSSSIQRVKNAISDSACLVTIQNAAPSTILTFSKYSEQVEYTSYTIQENYNRLKVPSSKFSNIQRFDKRFLRLYAKGIQ